MKNREQTTEWIRTTVKEKMAKGCLKIAENARQSHTSIEDIRAQMRRLLKETKVK